MRRKVAVLGASGYVGGELLRLLAGHPHLEVVRAISRSNAGEPLTAVHSHLRGARGLDAMTFSDLPPRAAAEGVDVVLLALQHGETMHAVVQLLELLEAPDGPTVVDLSGDFRLDDPALYRAHYGHEHVAPQLLGTFVYALPELTRGGELRGQRRISSPGCFATAAALAGAPLAASGRARGTLAMAGVTGASGSGRRPGAGTHFPDRAQNYRAYKLLTHQHEPEIVQTLTRLAAEDSCAWPAPRGTGLPFELVLTTHSAPLTRGIYITATAELDDPAARDEVAAAAERLYGGSRFVRLAKTPPELRGLAGTNFAELHLGFRGRHAVVTCAIDNLVKGAAGQALQSLNLALGLAEDEGLGFLGFTP